MEYFHTLIRQNTIKLESMDPGDDIAIQNLIREDADRGMAVLIEKYYGKVLRLCYSFMRNEEESRDLAQEIFLKLLKTIGHFKGKSRLSSWIYRVSVNACIDAKRKMKRNETVTIDENCFVLHENNMPLEPDISGIVGDAIAQLPIRYRTVIILRELENKSYRDIAEILDCSIGTVESRLYRGREMLRRLLAPYVRKAMNNEM